MTPENPIEHPAASAAGRDQARAGADRVKFRPETSSRAESQAQHLPGHPLSDEHGGRRGAACSDGSPLERVPPPQNNFAPAFRPLPLKNFRDPRRKNSAELIPNGAVKISTYRKQEIFVAVSDYPLVAPFTWYVNKDGYAQAMALGADGRKRPMMMHRLLMNAQRGQEVDHWDRDKLNNRRGNLRIATHGQNAANRERQATSGNRFKGVHWSKRTNRWFAHAKKDGKKHCSRACRTEEEAARAYDEMAFRLHGEFARLNFPLPGRMGARDASGSVGTGGGALS